ncbi:hypothetical protein QJS66_14630 [Kocuria rhizophila]|nr:hypothetical protein QJS66_14630 [Kocuria rhizophila]
MSSGVPARSCRRTLDGHPLHHRAGRAVDRDHEAAAWARHRVRVGGARALLLLVYTVVNVAAIILRRDRSRRATTTARATRVLPCLVHHAHSCWARGRRTPSITRMISLVLIALGVVLADELLLRPAC